LTYAELLKTYARIVLWQNALQELQSLLPKSNRFRDEIRFTVERGELEQGFF
jgi:hypothetical protein